MSHKNRQLHISCLVAETDISDHDAKNDPFSKLY